MNTALKLLVLAFLSILTAGSLSGCERSLPLGPATNIGLGDRITATKSEDQDLGDPASDAWRAVERYEIELVLAPAVHPSIALRRDGQNESHALEIQAVHNSEDLFLRLRWPDSTQNAATSRSEFADAVAVQFALKGGSSTTFMMGTPDQPVNIWYWKAGSGKPQNLAAGGFGSTTAINQSELSVTASYSEGFWQTVFRRPLASSGEHQVPLNDSATFALALWQGDARQRDGLKYVTMGWLELALTP